MLHRNQIPAWVVNVGVAVVIAALLPISLSFDQYWITTIWMC